MFYQSKRMKLEQKSRRGESGRQGKNTREGDMALLDLYLSKEVV